MILVEPGAVGLNFWKNWRMAAKASNSSDNNNDYLLYRQIENNMLESFKKMEQNAIHPSQVKLVSDRFRNYFCKFHFILQLVYP